MAKQTLQITDDGADSMDIINENFTEVYDDIANAYDDIANAQEDITDIEAVVNNASASAPASIDLAEDTDNGTNKITLTAPAVVASDKVLTLPDATDTLVGKDTTDTLTNMTLTSPTINTPIITNDCMFRVSRNAAANTGNNAFATVAFDTEQYDLGADVASGVFTAPADGYYTFSWNVGMTCDATARAIISALFINGTEYSRGTQLVAVASGISSSGGIDTVYLEAGQTADIRAYGAVALALRVGTISYTWFSGRYVNS